MDKNNKWEKGKVEFHYQETNLGVEFDKCSIEWFEWSALLSYLCCYSFNFGIVEVVPMSAFS